MEVNYQCGTHSKTWKVNMLHAGKRYIIADMDIRASEKLSPTVKYVEEFSGPFWSKKIQRRVAELRFPEPVAGTATFQLEEIG